MISDVRIGANDIAQLIERELEHAATNPLMNPNENIQSQLRTRGAGGVSGVSHNAT